MTTEAEAQALRRVEELLAEQARRDPHALRSERLTDLIGAWTLLAETARDGYDWSIYEYTNDVAVRTLLAEVLEVIPPDVLQWVRREVHAADEIFRAATRPARREAWGDERLWWTRRVPVNPGPELAGDLASDDL